MMNVDIINIDYKILNKNIPTIGVWDDHDYAINDGNGYYMHKETAKKYYLDFIDEPENSERRKYNRSIYTTYAFGSGHKSVRFILLDVRFHKQSYYVDSDADILDEEQWTWFEKTLVDNDETFTFIASGTQILPFNRILTESWYEKSRRRLFELIGRTQKSGVMLLSGDVHFAEISKTLCTIPEIGYDLYEITSSGMTHYFPKMIADIILARDYQVTDSFNGYNFAKFDFIWGSKKEDSSVLIKIIDIDNNVRIKKELRYTDFVHNTNIQDENCNIRINRRFKELVEYVDYYMQNVTELILLLLFYLFILFVLFLVIYIPIKIVIYIVRKIFGKSKSEKLD